MGKPKNTIKLGNTNFNKDLVKKMTFKQFTKIYEPILEGVTLKKAYEACGGVMPKKKEKK